MLRRYRIAVSATGEYTQYHGGTVEDALAAINATLTRVNEVFETDLSISLELVANNDEIIFTDPATDPYTDNIRVQVQQVLTTTIGNANYDVGHLFQNDTNNGNAGGIGTVCNNALKGAAFSSAEDPVGDLFDLDYVAHELGHQFGANHTWSFETEGTGVQAEPASGSTIMAYAGIVAGNNVAPNGDDYFHYNSIEQITTYVRTQACSQDVGLANNVPQISAIPDYVIPAGTAFVLDAEATDADATNELTYTWEQIDNGVVTTDTFGPDNPVGANFRSLPPTTDSFRFFPRLSRVLSGNLTQTLPPINSAWETVSTITRELNFAVTVRDNAPGGGQVASELVKVDVLGNTGPFRITSQSSAETFEAGSLIDVVWDVANTNNQQINAQTVDVLLSTDGGATFTDTLAVGLPNIGGAKVQLPGTASNIPEARLMIKPANNIFFAVNDANFAIQATSQVFNFDELAYQVCQPNDVTVNFTYEVFGGFAEETTLSATLPAGATAVFTPATVTTNNTPVVLQITGLNGATVGTYPITITGTSNSETISNEVSLSVFNADFAAVVLTGPENLAQNTAINPVFTWQNQANADSYDIEISSDENFNTILEVANVLEPTYTSTTLNEGSTYFWRARARNNCGVGNFSPPFSFSTIAVSCQTFEATDLPIEISDGAPSSITSTLTMVEGLTITEVQVGVQLTHTFVSDLVISLTSPAGTKVFLTSLNCSNSDDIDAVFSDSGNPLVCGASPAISGTVQPVGSLATFIGESTLGNWVLEVEDTFNQDGASCKTFQLRFVLKVILSLMKMKMGFLMKMTSVRGPQKV